MSAETLWTAQEAAAATGGSLNGNRDWHATGASIDSRTLQKGDLFIALHGANDGHDYVEGALGKGAVAAMVDRVPPLPRRTRNDTAPTRPVTPTKTNSASRIAFIGATQQWSKFCVV